jgi:hypothetical protein
MAIRGGGVVRKGQKIGEEKVGYLKDKVHRKGGGVRKGQKVGEGKGAEASVESGRTVLWGRKASSTPFTCFN